MTDKQKKIFVQTEADQYFYRNRSENTNFNSEYAFLGDYVDNNFKVLEIGCGDGRNSAIFTKNNGIQYHGLDPSQLAISAAKEKFPTQSFHLGTADELPFADQAFDFIYLGFFLYITDRELLPKIVFEVNRCLKPGGYLAITDFSPHYPEVRKYKHHSGILTFKFNHETMFTGFPQFKLIEKRPHHKENLSDENTWTATSVLIKRNIKDIFPQEVDKL